MFLHFMLKSGFRFPSLLLLSAILMLLVGSCSPLKKVQKRGGYILSNNTVKTDRPGISTYDLANFAQPKPNRKFLGLIRHRVWIYDAFSGKKNTKFRKWMRTHLGTPPVLLDSALVDNSLIPMKMYLNNKGYFGAEIARDIRIKGAKASVVYRTITSEPYKFGKISSTITDDSIRYFYQQSQSKTLLKSGSQYDAYLISDERERITKDLRDLGYFNFLREYIFFEVDTSSGNRIANLKMIIKNPKNSFSAAGDSLKELPHLRHFINNVYISTNPRILSGDSIVENDTLAYRSVVDSAGFHNPDFWHIYRENPRLRPEALARYVFLKPGDHYSQKNINLTYNRLQNLALSRYVSVNVVPSDKSFNPDSSGYALLDCDIRMVRSKVNLYTIEAEGTNSGGFVGIGSSFNYQNRNIFRGFETLRLKLYGGFEVLPPIGVGEEERNWLFNSLEGGIQTGLDFPSLLTPFKINQVVENSRNKTSISLGFNYQQRTQYLRYVSSLSMGYEWNSSLTTRHILTPVDISSISITRDSVFTDYLTALNDPRFLNQYTDHLIMAIKYSLIFNNQNLQAKKNFFYFRINLESAGNMLNLYSNVINASTDVDGNFTMFGIRYAQYLRGDFDFRYYRPVTARQKVVYRAAFGIGVPYGNSGAIPFEKGFFTGGANGLRGWPVRSLGPGAYNSSSSTTFENIGDLWIEANLEYRFPLYSFLEGALFTDIGNIWLLKQNEDFPGGEFRFDHMFETMALDGGLGFRFDFSFFIFRIDGGLPLYDPGQLSNNKWVRFSKFQMKDINWNFGIGYPF